MKKFFNWFKTPPSAKTPTPAFVEVTVQEAYLLSKRCHFNDCYWVRGNPEDISDVGSTLPLRTLERSALLGEPLSKNKDDILVLKPDGPTGTTYIVTSYKY